MLLCAQYILPITSKPLHNGAVLVKDGLIRDIGSAEMLKLRYPDEEMRDFGHAVLMPGFVDLHTHLEHSVVRGIVHDLPYAPWALKVKEISMRLDASDWYDSAILGGLEALSNGITTVADITTTGAACSAVQELGMRGVIYREVGAMDKTRIPRAMTRMQNDLNRWAGMIDTSRVTLGVAPAPMFECHPAMFGAVSEYAFMEKLPVAMHMAGSREEVDFIRYGSSPFAVHTMDDSRGFVEVPPWLPTATSPVRYALNWGAFEADNVLAVHCVHVDREDLTKLKEYDVSVALCPRANAQLGMGIAPLNEIRRAGIRMGFGTDSPAATDSTDMFIEMRQGMLFQRASNPGEFINSHAVLEQATLGGAKALKMDDRIGSLDIGKCADIVAVDLTAGSRQTALEDPATSVVNTCTGTDVLMTMVAGKVLYEQNRWDVDVDVAHNVARVFAIRGKIRS